MSEERRKRQQERDGIPGSKPKSRKVLVWGTVAVFFVVAIAAGRYHNNHHYDTFAKCLATKQAKMYGLYWCPHCLDQKEMFGKSFQYVPYVECAIKGSREMAAECKAAGAKNFPSWQFQGGPLQEGVLSLDALSAKTGCSLP
jgi:hypothetical protein